MTHTKQECCDNCKRMAGMAQPAYECGNPSCECHKQKSRAEQDPAIKEWKRRHPERFGRNALIEEIVREFEKSDAMKRNGWDKDSPAYRFWGKQIKRKHRSWTWWKKNARKWLGQE